MIILYYIVIVISFSFHLNLLPQPKAIALAWTQNTVNGVGFCKISVVSYNKTQFVCTKNGQEDDETFENMKPQPVFIMEVPVEE